ncbi:MAG: CvpA family protein [Rubripirellula sp.]|nr:CvpA family protein [Rubripirellula sp.]
MQRLTNDQTTTSQHNRMTAKAAADPTKMKLGQSLLVLAAIVGPACFFYSRGDSIAATLFAVTGVAALTGFRVGAASIFLLLAAGTVAFWTAPSVGIAFEHHFSGWLGTTGLTNRLISIVAVALGLTGIGIVASKLVGRWLAKSKKLDLTNRWIGFTLGAAEGATAMVLLLGGILIMEPRVKARAPLLDPEDRRGHSIAEFILQTSKQTRQSLIGPFLTDHNPFRTIPPLTRFTEIQDTVEALQDPNRIESVLNHPSIRQLQDSAEMQQAVKELHADPEVAEILRSRQVTGTMALTLLNHPAILKLVDQPGFLDAAKSAIHEIQPSPIVAP